MPEPYASNHDTFLENYINTQESRVLNNDLFVVGKHKSGYGTSIIFKLFKLPLYTSFPDHHSREARLDNGRRPAFFQYR